MASMNLAHLALNITSFNQVLDIPPRPSARLLRIYPACVTHRYRNSSILTSNHISSVQTVSLEKRAPGYRIRFVIQIEKESRDSERYTSR
ncbi:hypothetical protein PM082_003969 [Marasmius tenuissimus]|nr:hypothetical protein PM082_003969 [Marasmius tenuissimus]